MSTAPRHLILGTAGHVDHGKTSLVKALTGIDCDTHKEEKRRGITMNLGFAHLTLPDGTTLGIVDVPGHADFIHTMVGGASGIDLVMLVIAADSGVMPQTREHLQIMQALGVTHGFVALTKVDLLDDEMRELMMLEVQEFVAGTFLENSPVVAVSAHSGTGLEILRATLGAQCARLPQRAVNGPFRMYIDRVFTVSGHGTVVTGSVVCGALKTDETVWMLPDFAHRPLRVRALQCFGQAVPQVCAGDRASLNLMGLDRADYQRGQLISNFLLRPTQRIDARITLFAEAGQSLKRRGQVIFHAGTRMAVASTYLIDCDSLKGGESALVQLTLTMPFTLRADDRFILRNSSDSRTLGGGVVLDITPLHHRKRTDKLRQALELLVQGRAIDRLANEVRKAFHALSCTALAERVNTTEDEIAGVLQGKLPADILKLDGRHAPVLYTRSHEDHLRKQILSALGQFRVTHPLVEHGISYDELRSTLKVSEKADDEVLTHVLARLVEKQKVREVGRTWLLANDVVEVGGSTAQAIDALLEHIAGSGVQVPLASELNAIARRFGLGEKELRQILAHLVTAGKLYRIEGEYVYATRVDEMRQILTAHLVSHPEGITVAGFRDLIDGNRKFCLLLFALFDQEKLTRREGDVRVLVQAPPSLVPFT